MMTALFWTAGVLLALTGLPALLFLALFIFTDEPVAMRRAKAFYHWFVVVLLGSFDVIIFTHIVRTLWELWH